MLTGVPQNFDSSWLCTTTRLHCSLFNDQFGAKNSKQKSPNICILEVFGFRRHRHRRDAVCHSDGALQLHAERDLRGVAVERARGQLNKHKYEYAALRKEQPHNTHSIAGLRPRPCAACTIQIRLNIGHPMNSKHETRWRRHTHTHTHILDDFAIGSREGCVHGEEHLHPQVLHGDITQRAQGPEIARGK